MSDTDKTSQWQLTAISEVLGNLQIPINDSLSIGRGKDNDLVLASKKISRNHAQFDLENTELRFTDLGSANGSHINGERLEANKSHSIDVGDVLSLAGFEFRIDSHPEPLVDVKTTEHTKEAEPVKEQPITNRSVTPQEQDERTEEVKAVANQPMDTDKKADIEQPLVNASNKTPPNLSKAKHVSAPPTPSSNNQSSAWIIWVIILLVLTGAAAIFFINFY